jgi:peroxiredoxin family protein
MKASGRLGLYACTTTMQVFDFKNADLIPEVDSPAGATTSLDGAADVDITLKI